MTMVSETREVIEERGETCSSSVTTSTSSSVTTSTTVNFSKQNGTDSISIGDNVLHNGSASVKNVYLNGTSHKDQTCAIGSSEPEDTKPSMHPLTSTENTDLLNGKCYHQNKMYWHTQGGGVGWGCSFAAPSPPSKRNLKKRRFCRHVIKSFA